MDNLKEIILRIARPLEYATRSGTHGLSALKDLGRFVSQQVVTVLGHSVHPPGVEAAFLHLVLPSSDSGPPGPDPRGREAPEPKPGLNLPSAGGEDPAPPPPGRRKPANRSWS